MPIKADRWIRQMAETNGMIENIIRQQAAIMSFNDVFWLLAIMFVAMLPFILLMRPPRKRADLR